ncbi:selenide, water dikinase SelD, partial [bacterium]|nr:selenide, water dikinase SelD [bacterium]
IWSNTGARTGDHLILTKAIGTGTLCAGLKNGDFAESDIQDAIESMSQLNQIQDLLSPEELHSIHAATDITGFGIAGHSYQLARASKVTLALELSSIPLFEKTLESIRAENLTRAHHSNRIYTENHCRVLGKPAKEQLLSFFDPQTSGGLLLSVDADHSAVLLKKIQSRFPRASIIGRVLPHQGHELQLHD